MHDEAKDIKQTLMWAAGMISKSSFQDRERIARAYKEAQQLVAGIPKAAEGARPRIVACFERSDVYRAEDDIACVGWILTAVQERLDEGDLPDWRKLRKVVNQSVKLLPLESTTVH